MQRGERAPNALNLFIVRREASAAVAMVRRHLKADLLIKSIDGRGIERAQLANVDYWLTMTIIFRFSSDKLGNSSGSSNHEQQLQHEVIHYL